MEDFDENIEADIWYVDSRASTHMTRNKQWFEDFKKTKSGAKIYLGDDRGYQIKRHGNVPIILPDENIRHIQNMMYVPRINKNLIFVSMIIDQNLKVEFYKSYCVVKYLLDSMKTIATGIHVGSLYKMNVRSASHKALTSSGM